MEVCFLCNLIVHQFQVKSPANQREHKVLLERLVELEKSKFAQKQALKKAVELQKLRKNGEKNLLHPQMSSEIIKKDAKRILRPSLLTNRKTSFTLENRTTQSDNGHRALEQQLIFLRCSISESCLHNSNGKNCTSKIYVFVLLKLNYYANCHDRFSESYSI